jgi:hypothetical protein
MLLCASILVAGTRIVDLEYWKIALLSGLDLVQLCGFENDGDVLGESEKRRLGITSTSLARFRNRIKCLIFTWSSSFQIHLDNSNSCDIAHFVLSNPSTIPMWLLCPFSISMATNQTSTASKQPANGWTRRDRPCDSCRRRKSRCIIPQDSETCIMCQSRQEECTYVENPQRRKRRRADDGNSPVDGTKPRYFLIFRSQHSYTNEIQISWCWEKYEIISCIYRTRCLIVFRY